MSSEPSCMPLRNLWSAIGENAKEIAQSHPQWVAAVTLVAAVIFGWLVLPEPLGAIIVGIPLVAILGIFGKTIFYDIGITQFVEDIVRGMRGGSVNFHVRMPSLPGV